MGSFSLMHWLIVLLVLVLLFGRGKIPGLMSDFAEGIKAFKKGMADDPKPEAPKTISMQAEKPVDEVKDTAAKDRAHG